MPLTKHGQHERIQIGGCPIGGLDVPRRFMDVPNRLPFLFEPADDLATRIKKPSLANSEAAPLAPLPDPSTPRVAGVDWPTGPDFTVISVAIDVKVQVQIFDCTSIVLGLMEAENEGLRERNNMLDHANSGLSSVIEDKCAEIEVLKLQLEEERAKSRGFKATMQQLEGVLAKRKTQLAQAAGFFHLLRRLVPYDQQVDFACTQGLDAVSVK